MAIVIVDGTTLTSSKFLGDLFTVFKTSVLNAMNAYLAVTGNSAIAGTSNIPSQSERIGLAVTRGNRDIDDALDAAAAYLTEHPVDYVAYSQELQTLLSETKSAAQTVADNSLSDGQIAFDTLINNANIDYSLAVNKAYESMNSAISNAYIKDEVFNVSYFDYLGATYYVADAKLFSIKASNGKYWNAVKVTSDMLASGEEIKNSGFIIKADADSLVNSAMFLRTDLKVDGELTGRSTLTIHNGQYVSAVFTAGGDSTKQPAGRIIAKYSTITAEAKLLINGDNIVAYNGVNGKAIGCDTNGILNAKNQVVGTADKVTITALDYKSKVTLFMDEVSSVIDGASQRAYDAFSLAHKDIKSRLDTQVTTFVEQRSIVMFTGEVIKPISGIVFDQPSAFTFTVRNIGKVAWSGKMQIKVKDQYNKICYGGCVQVSLPADLTATKDVSLSITVPKEDPVTGYNFGSELSTYIIFINSGESCGV
jgi:hypothetical protein